MSEPPSQRDPSVDWARGVAALAMIEGHATHAWVSPLEKQSVAYGLTRLLATCPLPAFLLLSGMAVRLRLGAAARRGEAPGAVQRSIVKRGLLVFFFGYVTSAAYAAMDGHDGLRTFLRADVLQVIGLSIATLAWVCLGGENAVDLRRARVRALALLGVVLLGSPLFYRVVSAPSGAWGYLAAPFFRVPKVTLFPLIPLLAYAAFGYTAADLIARADRRRGLAYGATALCALTLALLCERATHALLGPGAALDDVHIAGVPNLLGYAARGLFLIAIAPLIVRRLPARAQAVVSRFGRASLIAYVFHIPFCYGKIGKALKGQLSVAECALPVLLLMLMSYAAIASVERLRAKRAAQLVRRTPAPNEDAALSYSARASANMNSSIQG